MSRLFHVLREIAADFAAAREASAAVSQHRMPHAKSLKRLGISAKDMGAVHI